MTPTLKKLRIACHPDKHGGDERAMEDFYALLKRNVKSIRNTCRRCGAVIGAVSTYCRICYRLPRLLTVLIVLVGLSAFAAGGSVTLAWDASPTAGCSYTLYGTTNAVLATTNAQLKVNCGTNLTVHATDIAPAALWRFAVTAAQGGVESDFSNVLILQVPVAPANMRSVALQYSGTLVGTNFLDALFLKLRIIP